MKSLRLLLFGGMCFGGALLVFAQVKGVVKDSDGSPLPGANVRWLNTSTGVSTSQDGFFTIEKPSNAHQLVFSFIGFDSDTIHVSQKNTHLDVILQNGIAIGEIQVVGRRMGTMKLRNSVMNADMITSAELTRAACCNLGESFVTNPSVDVNYADAATGAKQIRLLGLSGTYVQMLTENIPNYRGAAAPYGLGYVPGPWMQSIQVSKGTSSVKNGYEALTGQINVEFKKPQTADIVSANLFASSSSRYEANADASVRLNPRWSTMLLMHYENETGSHDSNNDGFLDLPRVAQYNLWNRWIYMGDNYVFQAGIKAMTEDRKSGQTTHGNVDVHDPYLIAIATDRYEFFTKNAYIFDKEKNTNLALILSATLHNQDATFGRKLYNVDQTNIYASLLFETEFSSLHSLSTGLSFNYDHYDQDYRLTNQSTDPRIRALSKEAVSGAYIQYTLNLNEKLVLMAGLRGDYSNDYNFFLTPRANVKYAPNDYVNFRASLGKGYRTNHVLAENNYLMASSREIHVAGNLKQEEAWNYGGSISSYIPLFGKTLNLNAEYYYTNFTNQVIVDMDSNPHAVSFSNLNGSSFSQVWQLEATYPLFEGFTLTAAYRRTHVKTAYDGVLMDKPLTGKFKSLFTASYKTPLGLWQFDATMQINGGGRMPTPYMTDRNELSWSYRYGSFSQLSTQVTRYFRHWSVYAGGENLTAFKQKNPIVGASNPWGNTFDSTMIWGPMHGAKIYIGFRFNLERI